MNEGRAIDNFWVISPIYIVPHDGKLYAILEETGVFEDKNLYIQIIRDGLIAYRNKWGDTYIAGRKH